MGEYGYLRKLALEVSGIVAGYLRDHLGDPFYAKPRSGDSIIADIEAEKLVVTLLRKRGFDGLIVSEESGTIRGKSEDLVALVDPLDGSTNYSSGIPWCSVSIAFAINNGKKTVLEDAVVAGAIAPISGSHIISFEKNDGVFIDNTKIEELGNPKPIVFVYMEEPEPAVVVYKYRSLSQTRYKRSVKVRSMGSAALELAYTGLGLGEAFIDVRAKLRNIDIATAAGIVKEMNGKVTNVLGKPIETRLDIVDRVRSVIAGATIEHYEMITRSIRDSGLIDYFRKIETG